jgi:mono/diheme cytochrome c family protein
MKYIAIAAALAALSGCVVAGPAAPAALTEAQLVARGEYLVNGLVGCHDCHTPMTPTGPDMTQALQGAELGFEPTVAMPWGAYAPALAGGPANYTDAQFVHLLQTGVRPDGSRPRPPMPQFRMNEDDARAVVAYIKTLPPAAG